MHASASSSADVAHTDRPKRTQRSPFGWRPLCPSRPTGACNVSRDTDKLGRPDVTGA